MPPWITDWTQPGVPWAALAIVGPLAMALAAALWPVLARALVWPAGLANVAVAALACAQVWQHGAIELAVGGWRPPLGISLRLDGLAGAMLLVASLVSLAALVFARAGLAEGPARQEAAFWPLAFCILAALHASLLGADLFNLYVALELLTVSAVALVALEGTPAALAAALRYLFVALAGSLAYLLGVALLYARSGTLDLHVLRAIPLQGGGEFDLLLAVALITTGLLAKGALFPLHGWLAPAHAAAPAPASALLSALVVKAPIVILLRVWFEALPGLPTPSFAQLVGALGAAAILLGSLLALREERLKRLVAYSTVAQLGYVLLVFPLGAAAARDHEWAAAAWTGAAFHLMAHALAKAAMFLSAGAMLQGLGHDRIDGMAGVGGAMPVSAFAFALAAVSLMGLPPSGGFTGKYLLLTAALGSGQWWWAAVILLGGLLAAAYLFRPLSCFMADARPALHSPVPLGRQVIALVLALGAIGLGLLSAAPARLLAPHWAGEVAL
ncbi:hypothetical protein JI739_08020 [Ramlibacter sp. AW1]|uniref:NADH:quinone oxidoreductase/Mrp antiporter transmembrane domain-containing protein n=1 Tax=Ramlibacter aurantiacus TaxID=2801330 RepID=A0A936ZI50_9BURK|nr:proton-conducting transporter membrane subunit [Ramlibacter aurantiacus]MBL0420287.1 hypothetical protein [Ramlibacter aurantiacus]